MAKRVVRLRAEVSGADRRYLDAYIESDNLVLAGQDLGPSTAAVSGDGEYEWWRTVKRADIPALSAVLGGAPDEDILDVLERVATGDGSYELERLLRDGVVPCDLCVW
jgi:hypothetical protein